MKAPIALAAVLLFAALPSVAHEKHAPDAAAPAVAPINEPGTRDARSYFTDTELTTQDGRRVRFYSDVLAGRTVLLNVIFTSCEDACPLITRQLAFVADKLDGRLGKDVHFISISSDPVRDTPAALQAFAKKNDASRDGWTFLTGDKAAVDIVLQRLGQLSRSPEEHSTLLIAGNVPAKRWSKIRPDAPVAAVAERLKVLANGK
jgi:cytochrome oxidase Cu insertion factor (SCO1/SenC/PrrC family)